MERRDLAARAVDETHGLHDFFAAWFRADSGPTPDFARCEAALAPDFRMVTPDGRVQDRAAVIERVLRARGSAPADYSIAILQPEISWRSGDAVLLEFIERQYREGQTVSRRSSALFTDAPRTPNGVAWRHLHETWMQE